MASIEKRNEEGTKWLLIASEGSGKSRKKTSRMFNGSEKKAWEAAVLFEQEVKEGKYCRAGKKYTFQQFVDVWREDYGEVHLAPKTLARYNAMLDSRILPEIGSIRMDKIRPMTINRFMKDLAKMPLLTDSKKTLSAQTLKHHFRCISSILQDAYEWEVITSNPCMKIKAPHVEKPDIDCYDENQAAAFLKALDEYAVKMKSTKHKALIYLAIASGAREGEIMGLEWQHIDFTNNTIAIEQASQYLPGHGTYKKVPKNRSSKRTISMPKNVMALLNAYRVEQIALKVKLGNLWQGGNDEKRWRVFTTREGLPGYPQWPGKWLNTFLEANKLPHTTFHGLRHLSATLLIKDGIPLKQVSKRLGHTVVGTTGDIYAHALESVDKRAANKIGRALDKAQGKKAQRKPKAAKGT